MVLPGIVELATQWLYELTPAAEGLSELAVASGLELYPIAARFKPFRLRDTLLYSSTAAPEWTRAFFAREIARRALESVGAEQSAAALRSLVPEVRRRAAVAACAQAAGAMSSARKPARQRAASSVHRLTLPTRP